jgi:hypothetical protein
MKIFSILFASALSFNAAQAQNNTVSAGGDASGSNGSVSYSVGQVFYTSAEGENGSISQGVQQAYDIGVVTGVENRSIEATLFPNPTVGNVQLDIADFTQNTFEMNLFDAAGKLILSQKIAASTSLFSLNEYASGVYTLSIMKDKEQVKSFRIVRNY